MKQFLKRTGLAVWRFFRGIDLVDQRTGKRIGRVVVVGWKGGLRIIGLDGVPVRAHFTPQKKEVYWAQDLAFSTHPPPDFPHVENHHRHDLAPVPAGSGGDVPDVAAPES